MVEKGSVLHNRGRVFVLRTEQPNVNFDQTLENRRSERISFSRIVNSTEGTQSLDQPGVALIMLFHELERVERQRFRLGIILCFKTLVDRMNQNRPFLVGIGNLLNRIEISIVLGQGTPPPQY